MVKVTLARGYRAVASGKGGGRGGAGAAALPQRSNKVKSL